MPGFNMSQGMGNFGMASMVIGAVSSAVGARDAANMQGIMLSAQAQMDKINARSSAMAMNGQADLDFINQKSGFEAMSFNSTMNMMGVKENIFNQEAGAQMNMLGAESSAAMTITSSYSHAALGILQSTSQANSLNTGAQIDEQNAALMEMQAQSTLLHGETAEQNSDMQYAQVKSHATVQMARGNIDMAEGAGVMQKVGIDLMSQRAADLIKQDTLMQAFGQRVQESNMRMSAGQKRAQAASVLEMGKVQAATDIKLGDMSAAATLQNAQLKSALTHMNSEFELGTAQAQFDWTSSMMKAGMVNAEAGLAYKHTMAEILVKNSAASAAIKNALASGINPDSAFLSSLLSGAGQVANSWYQMNRTTG